MNWKSQAGQDRMAHHIATKIAGVKHPVFWDIGCGDEQFSNTLALEELGWNGIALDQLDPVEALAEHRRALYISADATTMDWLPHIPVSGQVEYLSLDVDHASLQALNSLPLKRVTFCFATVEHDAYRFGDDLRPDMRKIMSNAAYHLLCADVKSNDYIYEDSFVNPGRPFEVLTSFTRNNQEGWSIDLP